MDINKIMEDLAKQIAKILISSLPGASPFADFASVIFSGIRFSEKDSFRDTVKTISKSIARDIYKNLPPDIESPGTTISGLYDLEKCIEASNLSLEKLFELGLDREKISNHIWKSYPKDLLDSASEKRRDVVRTAIDFFSQRMLFVVPNLQGFTILSIRYLINLNEKMDSILSKLENMKRI